MANNRLHILLSVLLIVVTPVWAFGARDMVADKWRVRWVTAPTMADIDAGLTDAEVQTAAKGIGLSDLDFFTGGLSGAASFEKVAADPIGHASTYATGFMPVIWGLIGSIACMALFCYRICAPCCCAPRRGQKACEHVLFLALLVACALPLVGVLVGVSSLTLTPQVDDLKATADAFLASLSESANAAVFSTFNTSIALDAIIQDVNATIYDTEDAASLLSTVDTALGFSGAGQLTERVMDVLGTVAPLMDDVLVKFDEIVDGIGTLCTGATGPCTPNGTLGDISAVVDAADGVANVTATLPASIVVGPPGSQVTVSLGPGVASLSTAVTGLLDVLRDSLVALDNFDLASVASFTDPVVEKLGLIENITANAAVYSADTAGFLQMVRDVGVALADTDVVAQTNKLLDIASPDSPLYGMVPQAYSIIGGGVGGASFGLDGTAGTPLTSTVANYSHTLATDAVPAGLEEVFSTSLFTVYYDSATHAVYVDRSALDDELSSIADSIDDQHASVADVTKQVDVFKYALFGLLVGFLPLVLALLLRSSKCANCFLFCSCGATLIVGLLCGVFLLAALTTGDACVAIDAAITDPVNTASAIYKGAGFLMNDTVDKLPQIVKDGLEGGEKAVFKPYSLDLGEFTSGFTFPTLMNVTPAIPEGTTLTWDLSGVDIGALFRGTPSNVLESIGLDALVDAVVGPGGLLRNDTLLGQTLKIDEIEAQMTTELQEQTAKLEDTIVNSGVFGDIKRSVDQLTANRLSGLLPDSFNATMTTTASSQIDDALSEYADLLAEILSPMPRAILAVQVSKGLPETPYLCFVEDSGGAPLADWPWVANGTADACDHAQYTGDPATFFQNCMLDFKSAGSVDQTRANAFLSNLFAFDALRCGQLVSEGPSVYEKVVDSIDVLRTLAPTTACPSCGGLTDALVTLKTTVGTLTTNLVAPSPPGMMYTLFDQTTDIFTCGTVQTLTNATGSYFWCGADVTPPLSPLDVCLPSDTWDAPSKTCKRLDLELIFDRMGSLAENLFADYTCPGASPCEGQGLVYWAVDHLSNNIAATAPQSLTDAAFGIATSLLPESAYSALTAALFSEHTPFSSAPTTAAYTALDESMCFGGVAAAAYSSYFMMKLVCYGYVVGIVAAFLAAGQYRTGSKKVSPTDQLRKDPLSDILPSVGEYEYDYGEYDYYSDDEDPRTYWG